jgi:hypothetical protein
MEQVLAKLNDEGLPEFKHVIVLCASFTPGEWKIVGRYLPEGADSAPHTLLQSSRLDALRELLKVRGYTLREGRLLEEHHTGVEIHQRPGEGDGL